MITSHVKMNVNGETYTFLIRPESWSKVDIVDFSPRVVTGMPSRSELGLYLDVGQESFLHGYGEERFVSSQRYAYTGHLVDTSHGFACLYTQPELVGSVSASSTLPPSWCIHRDLVFIGTYTNLYVVRPSTGTLTSIIAMDLVTDLLSTGTRMFIARRGTDTSARMYLSDAGQVQTATSNTLVPMIAPYWKTNIWAGGMVMIVDGRGMGQIYPVASNTSTTITISGTWSTVPDTTSYFVVWNNGGSSSNPPYDFTKLALFGGYVWAAESYEPWLHYWADTEGETAEGGQGTDVNAIRVGPGNYFINNMIAFNNQLLVMREDGIWAIGDDNVAYHLLNFGDEAHINNFRAACVWNGFLYFSVRNKLYRYKSGIQDVTPPPWDKHWPYKTFGDFRALVPRGKFLYAFGMGSTTNAIEATETSMFGVMLKTDDAVSWHKVLDISAAPSDIVGVPIAFLDPVGDYIYYGGQRSSGTVNIYRVKLDPMGELPYKNFPTTGSHNLYLSYYDLGMIPINKSFARVTLDGDFPTGTSVVVSYRVDNETNFTTLGTITATNMYCNFPSGVTGKRIQLRLDLRTTSSSYTPVVRAVILKCMARPDVKYGCTFDVLVEDDQANAWYGSAGTTAAQIRQGLEAARASVAPIIFTDIHGDSAPAYLSSLRYMLHDYVNENGEVVRTSLVARCTIVYV
jgi:hypothetical protein